MIASTCSGGIGVDEGGTEALPQGAEQSPRPWASAVRARRERQQSERKARIDELVEHAEQSSGGPVDRAYWSLVYDLELAPMTSNRKQLLEIGVEVVPPSTLDDGELSLRLWDIINALADLNTYLLHTDHLSDRELYERLAEGILDEPVHDIYEGSGGREFIELGGAGGADTRSVWLAFYADDEERAEIEARGEQLPPRRVRPYDRDRALPVPE